MEPIENFARHNADMLDAAAQCLARRQFMPALVLMYSHIDTLAWAASDQAQVGVARRFEAWVNRWLLPHLHVSAPDLQASELYAARCGVLHTLTGKSRLSETGRAREVVYAWGTGKVDELRFAVNHANLGSRAVALHFDALLESLGRALDDMMVAARRDNTLASALAIAAGKHYAYIPLPDKHA